MSFVRLLMEIRREDLNKIKNKKLFKRSMQDKKFNNINYYGQIDYYFTRWYYNHY